MAWCLCLFVINAQRERREALPGEPSQGRQPVQLLPLLLRRAAGLRPRSAALRGVPGPHGLQGAGHRLRALLLRDIR